MKFFWAAAAGALAAACMVTGASAAWQAQFEGPDGSIPNGVANETIAIEGGLSWGWTRAAAPEGMGPGRVNFAATAGAHSETLTRWRRNMTVIETVTISDGDSGKTYRLENVNVLEFLPAADGDKEEIALNYTHIEF